MTQSNYKLHSTTCEENEYWTISVKVGGLLRVVQRNVLILIVFSPHWYLIVSNDLNGKWCCNIVDFGLVWLFFNMFVRPAGACCVHLNLNITHSFWRGCIMQRWKSSSWQMVPTWDNKNQCTFREFWNGEGRLVDVARVDCFHKLGFYQGFCWTAVCRTRPYFTFCYSQLFSLFFCFFIRGVTIKFNNSLFHFNLWLTIRLIVDNGSFWTIQLIDLKLIFSQK